jgi:hypothetical protein
MAQINGRVQDKGRLTVGEFGKIVGINVNSVDTIIND